MNYLNSLTLAWQQDEISKETGDNSMAVKPLCGDPEISKSQRQEEEHMAKAKLPEPQTHIGGSHSLLIPDKGQLPYVTRTLGCASDNNHRDDADCQSDNGRTGRLSAHDHNYWDTTGSPKQESLSCMATESPYYSMCWINVQGIQARLRLGREAWYNQRVTDGKSTASRGKGDSQIPKKTT